MSKKVISTSKATAAIGPYSQANFINGVLYISGQIPIDPETGNLVDGIEKETHQVMKNLKAILQLHNFTISPIKMTGFSKTFLPKITFVAR